ncbi:glycerate kinase [Pokkaliibacter sp. CJK22405]|uniref:glycerate kinase n=1 Tax=Pokkaliibacter sp. CJK22405 TaxID=3384615 RepID=UPI003984CD2A
MKLLIAPAAFKGTLTAFEAAQAIEAGWTKVFARHDLSLFPFANGGEGTAELLTRQRGGEFKTYQVRGPLNEPVDARLGLIDHGRTAVLDVSTASGLRLLHPEHRAPVQASSYGTGELIRHALDLGVEKIIVGLGDSATNDAGAGLFMALGGRLFDAHGNLLGDTANGGTIPALAQVFHVDLANFDERIYRTRFELVCDVSNPILGSDGATRVYGPQKGIAEDQMPQFEAALTAMAAVLHRDLGIDITRRPHSGAAGGIGGMMMAAFRAEAYPGARYVMEHCGLEAQLAEADLVITGEGRSDQQSPQEKVPLMVLDAAKRMRTPSIMISGAIINANELMLSWPASAMFASLTELRPLPDVLESAAADLEMCTYNLARTMKLSLELGL